MVQQKCLVRSKRADEDWREVFVKCCQRLVQFHFEVRLHIVASTRTGEPGGVCTDKTSSKLLRRQFRLLSRVKSGRGGKSRGSVHWICVGRQHHLHKSETHTSQVILSHFQCWNLLVKIYPPVAICVCCCKHRAELSGGIFHERGI